MINRLRMGRDTLVLTVAWLAATAFALSPLAPAVLPSPWTALGKELFGNSHRDWYWIASVVPVNLVGWAGASDRREQRLIAITSAAVTASAFVSFLLAGGAVAAALYSSLKCCALLGLGILILQARRQDGLESLLVALMFSTYLAMRLSYLPLTCLVRQDTLDLFTYAFDSSMGFNPALWSFSVYHSIPLAKALLRTTYLSIMALPISLHALQRYRPDPTTAPALRVFVAASALGFAVYLLFPVSGPVYFLGESYGDRPIIFHGLHSVAFKAVWRNGVPSIHFSTALLMFLNVPRTLKLAKTLFLAFCLMTLVATMGNGEHYFFDLLCALPFVSAVNALCLWLNPDGDNANLRSCLRSITAFVALLALLAIAPSWLFTRVATWALSALVCTHFAYEIRCLGRAVDGEKSAGSTVVPDELELIRPLPGNG